MYVYKRLSVKSFHEVWAGNAHGYSLKSRIGKVSMFATNTDSHITIASSGLAKTLTADA